MNVNDVTWMQIMNAVWMQAISDDKSEPWHKIRRVGPDSMVSSCLQPFRGKIRVTIDYPGVGAHVCRTCAESSR